MRVVISYTKARLVSSYAGIANVVTYSKAIISKAYAGISEVIKASFSDSVKVSETGYLAMQDYVDPTYFATGDYVATEYRTF